jgi:hypothetical protein
VDTAAYIVSVVYRPPERSCQNSIANFNFGIHFASPGCLNRFLLRLVA